MTVISGTKIWPEATWGSWACRTTEIVFFLKQYNAPVTAEYNFPYQISNKPGQLYGR